MAIMRYYNGSTWVKLDAANADTVDNKHVDDAKTDTSALWTASKIISTVNGKVTGGTSNFLGNGAEVTIAHGLGAVPKTVSVVPTANPNGYMGEMWVRSDATNIYVGNSGTFTGAFMWLVVKT
jgi:hypothetical protein